MDSLGAPNATIDVAVDQEPLISDIDEPFGIVTSTTPDTGTIGYRHPLEWTAHDRQSPRA